MHSFSLPEPDWNRFEAASLTASPVLLGNHRVVIRTQYGQLFISIGEQGLRITSEGSDQPQFNILKSDIDCAPVTLDNFSDYSRITTQVTAGDPATRQEARDPTQDNYVLLLFHQPLHFELYWGDNLVQRSATDGHFVRQHRLPPFAKTPAGWLISLELSVDEPVYGLGEKWGKLDKRGQLIRSFNHDALGVNAERSYKNTPYAWSPTGWSFFVHTPAPVTHAIGFAQWSQRAYICLVEDDILDLFLYQSDSPAASIYHYCQLTGFAPVPPQWSTGVILSKAYYKNAAELLSVAREVRERKMPCDVITLDGRAWQDTETRFAFEWDPQRYADPKPILDQLKAMNFKICVWEYPMISVKNPLFEQAASKGWLIKYKHTGQAFRYKWDPSPFGRVLTPLPDSGILDFTHPEAYAFWRDSHQQLFELGVDMIKADFGEQLEDENMLSHSGDSGIRLHNVYSMLYNRCVYEAAVKFSRHGPFIFSRSAWTGSQCYPAQWGGDPQADWHGLAASIRGSLAWGLSGGPYYATDIGGFYKDMRDVKLYIRWTQAAVFAAHMRLHGIGDREPWSYNRAAEKAVFAALQLRYQLLPYIQETTKQAHLTGLPVQRAMPLAFPDQRLTWQFEHQFMCGEKLLVVPCITPDDTIEFFLPEGAWQRFPGNQTYAGGKLYREALALDQMAVFVRAGETLQLGTAVEHTDQLSELSTWHAH